MALPSDIRAGKGEPTTNGFAVRYCVRIHGEGVGDAHPLRFDNRGMFSVDRLDHLGQMGLIDLFAFAERCSLFRYLDGMADGIYPEKVGASIAEIAFLPIHHFPF